MPCPHCGEHLSTYVGDLPFVPGFPAVALPSALPMQRIEVPISIRGMRLGVTLERRGTRIYATLNVPTRWGLLELAVGMEEAPIREALARAASSELGRLAGQFFQVGDSAALAQINAILPQVTEDVLGLASDAALPELARQALSALDSYGPATVGAAMLPGWAAAGAYESTFIHPNRW